MAKNIWQTEPFARLVRAQNRAVRGDKSVFNELVELLGSPVPYVRHGAASALGSLGDKRAIEYLLPLLRDSSYMGEGTPFIGTATDDRFSVAGGASQGLWLLGDAAVPALLDALRDPAWRTRRWAVDALGRRRDAHFVEAIANLLADDVRKVRRAASLA